MNNPPRCVGRRRGVVARPWRVGKLQLGVSKREGFDGISKLHFRCRVTRDWSSQSAVSICILTVIIPRPNCVNGKCGVKRYSRQDPARSTEPSHASQLFLRDSVASLICAIPLLDCSNRCFTNLYVTQISLSDRAKHGRRSIDSSTVASTSWRW